jgi:hypothetical protein
MEGFRPWQALPGGSQRYIRPLRSGPLLAAFVSSRVRGQISAAGGHIATQSTLLSGVRATTLRDPGCQPRRRPQTHAPSYGLAMSAIRLPMTWL